VIGAVVVAAHVNAVPVAQDEAGVAEDLELCADDHSLALLLTRRMRSLVQTMAVTPETASQIERSLDRARNKCSINLNAAEALTLGTLYEMLGRRTFAAQMYANSKRQFAAALVIFSTFPKPTFANLDVLQELAQSEYLLGDSLSADELVTRQELLAREWVRNKSIPLSGLVRALEFASKFNETEGHHKRAQDLLLEARSLDDAK
jgi:hypothetical protein